MAHGAASKPPASNVDSHSSHFSPCTNLHALRSLSSTSRGSNRFEAPCCHSQTLVSSFEEEAQTSVLTPSLVPQSPANPKRY